MCVLKQFLNHIKRFGLATSTDKVLLAVSGGLDSMVMLDLFLKAGFTVGVAHVNFQLRGDESKGDELFVKQMSKAYGVPAHVKRFNTAAYASKRTISIQMAARTLRYDFFDSLVKEHGYSAIATAHHINDSIETLLLNLIRGTGITGITGIPSRNGKIIRPLLFATRELIASYASEHDLIWREDSSNDSADYHRNLLRHKVIPILKQINPNLENGFIQSLERLTGAKDLAMLGLDEWKKYGFIKKNNQVEIDLVKLREVSWPSVVLWETIKSMGFSYDQCVRIVENHMPGKRFTSNTHTLYVDRSKLIVREIEAIDRSIVEISNEDISVSRGSEVLTLDTFSIQAFVLTNYLAVAYLDADKIEFPLQWRAWKAGDLFTPLGMKGKKKVSDFLIDIKVPVPDKEKVTVLTANNTILWVVGYRLDDRVKITSTTQQVLRITVAQQEN